MVRVFAAGDTTFTSNGDAILRPFSARARNELNGDFTLELVCSNSDRQYINGDSIIVVDLPIGAQAFRVQKVAYTGTKTTVSCRHISFDADNYVIESASVTGLSALGALDAMNTATEPQSPFTLYSDISETNEYKAEYKSLSEAVEDIREVWGGDLRRDNFTISLIESLYDDNGTNISYRRGIKEISAEYDWSEVVTKLLPVGEDGLILNPKYIESTIQYDNPFCKTVTFSQSHIERENYNNDDTAYKNALLADLQAQAEAYLELHCKPAANYTIRGASDVEGIYDLGDVAHVMDERIGVDIVTRLCAYEYDCIAGRFVELQFGETKKKLSDLTNTEYHTPTAADTTYKAGDTWTITDFQTTTKAADRKNFSFTVTLPKSMVYVTPTVTAATIALYSTGGTAVSMTNCTFSASKVNNMTAKIAGVFSANTLTSNATYSVVVTSLTLTMT